MLDLLSSSIWLARKTESPKKIIEYSQNYQLGDIYREVYDFCNDELSSFYFDVRKDTLYCSSYDSIERRSCRTVMNILFNYVFSRYGNTISCNSDSFKSNQS